MDSKTLSRPRRGKKWRWPWPISDEALAHIRAGKANPKILDGIRVEYYGSAAPISNVANISVPDARTIAITPWEKAMFKEIERGIINSEVRHNP